MIFESRLILTVMVTIADVIASVLSLALLQQRQQRQKHKQKKEGSISPLQPKKLGTSFSIAYAQWLQGEANGPAVGPTWRECLKTILALDFDVIRLPLPWSEIEIKPGVYDFTTTEEAIVLCEAHSTPVILCFGVKNLRWPEVYIPEFYRPKLKPKHDFIDDKLAPELLAYLKACLKRYGHDKRVSAIQIENEALEPTGPGAPSRLLLSLVRQEVGMARTMATKPIVVTMGAGFTETVRQAQQLRPQLLQHLLDLAPDALGWHLYRKGYWQDQKFEVTTQHWQLAKQLNQRVRAAGVTPYITELQAEPWESQPAKMNFCDPEGNKSLTPSDLLSFYDQTKQLDVDTALFWGLEFQVACAHQGNSAWLEATKQILTQSRASQNDATPLTASQ